MSTTLRQITSVVAASDDPADLEEVSKLFGRVHCDFKAVQGGLELWNQLFNEHAARPELMIIDLHLAKINGLALVQRMRCEEATRDIPVILLTNSTVEQHLLHSFDLGRCVAIPKPLSYAKLLYSLPFIRLSLSAGELFEQ